MRGTPLRALAALVVCLTVTRNSAAEESGSDPADFDVMGIEVEGLQRISEGTLYNVLPINIGDRLTAQRVREAVRALYGTGFFRDVQLRRDGNTLIVVVLERPSIESFEITGNKDIKTEELQKSLRNVGLAAGKTFDRSVLEDVKGYLTDQYFSRGKYAARIDARVEEMSGNRVKVKIDIKEGKRARIRQITVIGNHAFSQQEITEGFELHTPNWQSWYKQDDRYSRESLQGDLEKLRAFYMDRGYANFQVDSTQVAISAERDDIFITVNVAEGRRYRVSQVRLAGNFVIPEAALRKLLLVQPGQIYSRKAITATQELIQNRLGEDGYAFAKVDPVPTVDEDGNEIALTFFIDPRNRVYVRNITFSEVKRLNDEVLRREMRQLEGGWLSNTALERSKQRLQRLPYIKKVDSTTTPVEGSPDQVDVDFRIEEGPSAQLSGGLGYSEAYKLMLNGNYTEANFLGTGQRIAVDLSGGAYNRVYSISHTNPYTTIDGVSRTINFSYVDQKQLTSTTSTLSTTSYIAGLEYGYPITEYQFVRFGLSGQHVEYVAPYYSSEQLQDWVRRNGNSYFRPSGASDVVGTRADILELSAGWSYDGRNRTLFPTAGGLHRLVVTSAVPGTQVEYMTATYEYEQYFHLPGLSILPFRFDTRASYATAFGDTTGVPPNHHFFTGGMDSVRGFREYTLGPRDSLGNPYGGDAALTGQFEALLPTPGKFASTVRATLFFDFGNSFFLGNTTFTDKRGLPIQYRFDWQQLRTSVGIGVQWLAPLGLFRFSLGIPIHYQLDTSRKYGDERELFQFAIGNAF
jgi:outer membrane protein insertion porin family